MSEDAITARVMVDMQAKLGHAASLFIQKYGRHGAATPLPPGIKRGRMGRCYQNAGRIACGSDSLIYCEGLALREGSWIAVEHAWLLDAATGKFVDPTWPEEGGDYYGIAFKPEYLRRTVLDQGIWGCLWFRRVGDSDAPEFLYTGDGGKA